MNYFAEMERHLRPKTASEILAVNLRRWMLSSTDLRTQTAVAKKATIAQTSVGLMLDPTKRRLTASGKMPSPKLQECELVAQAFGKQLWQLVMSDDDLEQVIRRAVMSGDHVSV